MGKDPWHPGTDCYLDDLRVYSSVLRRKFFIEVLKIKKQEKLSH